MICQKQLIYNFNKILAHQNCDSKCFVVIIKNIWECIRAKFIIVNFFAVKLLVIKNHIIVIKKSLRTPNIRKHSDNFMVGRDGFEPSKS